MLSLSLQQAANQTYASLVQYALVIALGAFVGGSEIISRYRDSPYEALKSPPGIIYISLNAAAAVLVLRLAVIFDWTFGLDLIGAQKTYLRTLACGIAAMGILRTSLFNANVKGATVPIGLGAILDVLLEAADRSVDRKMAIERAEGIPAIMEGVEFGHAVDNLPAFCLALMQNLDPKDQQQLAQQIELLKQDEKLDERTKVRNLGLLLVDCVGKRVLRRAVHSIKQDQAAGARPDSWLDEVLDGLGFEQHADRLSQACLQLVPDTDLATRADIARTIESLAGDDTKTDEQRLRTLALLLARTFGQDVVKSTRSVLPGG